MVHTRPPIGSLADLRGKILRVNNLVEGNALRDRYHAGPHPDQ